MLTESGKVGILLIDDQVLFRIALAEFFRGLPDMEVIGQAGTINEAITLLAEQTPDLILLEYDLTGELASEFFSKLPGIGARTPVMVFSSGMSADATRRLYRLGATAVLSKSSTPREFVQDIRRALCEPSAFRWRPTSSEPPRPNLTTLTTRQRYVAKAVLQSKPSKLIAAEMGVTESTVKSTLKRIFEKTGTRSRAELVRTLLDRSDLHSDGSGITPITAGRVKQREEVRNSPAFWREKRREA